MLLTLNISLDLAPLINSVLTSANQDIHGSFEVQIWPFEKGQYKNNYELKNNNTCNNYQSGKHEITGEVLAKQHHLLNFLT